MRECYDEFGQNILRLTQWDLNRVVTIQDFEYEETPIVHFAHINDEKSLVVTDDDVKLVDGELKVKVPNELLLTSESILMNIFIYDGENNKGINVENILLPVQPKPQPNDYVYVDNVDVVELSTLKLSLQTAITNAQRDVNAAISSLEQQYQTTQQNLVTQLNTAKTELENRVNNALQDTLENIKDGTPKGIFSNESDLVNKEAGIYLYFSVTDTENNGYIYYWDGNTLSDRLILYNSVEKDFELTKNKATDIQPYKLITGNNEYPSINAVTNFTTINRNFNATFKDGIFLTDGTISKVQSFRGYKHTFLPVVLNRVYHIVSWGATDIENERMVCFIKDNNVLESFGKGEKDRYIFITESSNIIYAMIYKFNDSKYILDEVKTLSEIPNYIVINNFNETLNEKKNLPIIEELWLSINDIVLTDGDGSKYLSDRGIYESFSRQPLYLSNNKLLISEINNGAYDILSDGIIGNNNGAIINIASGSIIIKSDKFCNIITDNGSFFISDFNSEDWNNEYVPTFLEIETLLNEQIPIDNSELSNGAGYQTKKEVVETVTTIHNKYVIDIDIAGITDFYFREQIPGSAKSPCFYRIVSSNDTVSQIQNVYLDENHKNEPVYEYLTVGDTFFIFDVLDNTSEGYQLSAFPLIKSDSIMQFLSLCTIDDEPVQKMYYAPLSTYEQLVQLITNLNDALNDLKIQEKLDIEQLQSQTELKLSKKANKEDIPVMPEFITDNILSESEIYGLDETDGVKIKRNIDVNDGSITDTIANKYYSSLIPITRKTQITAFSISGTGNVNSQSAVAAVVYNKDGVMTSKICGETQNITSNGKAEQSYEVTKILEPSDDCAYVRLGSTHHYLLHLCQAKIFLNIEEKINAMQEQIDAQAIAVTQEVSE